MRINNNITAMNAHRQYSINNASIAKNVEKLSSGYRINRAGDDAAGLAISEKMRAQIRGLTMASKNSQDAVSLIQTAEGALQSTHDVLQRMRELAVQSASDTNETTIDRAALQQEFKALLDEINDTATKTRFNDQNLLDGTFQSSLKSLNNANNATTLSGINAINVDRSSAGNYSVDVSVTSAKESETTAGIQVAVEDADLTALAAMGSKISSVTFSGLQTSAHNGNDYKLIVLGDKTSSMTFQLMDTNNNIVATAQNVNTSGWTDSTNNIVSFEGVGSFTFNIAAGEQITTVDDVTRLSGAVLTFGGTPASATAAKNDYIHGELSGNTDYDGAYETSVKATAEYAEALKDTDGYKDSLKGTTEYKTSLEGTDEYEAFLKGTTEYKDSLKTTTEYKTFLEGTDEYEAFLKGTAEYAGSLKTTTDYTDAIEATTEYTDALGNAGFTGGAWADLIAAALDDTDTSPEATALKAAYTANSNSWGAYGTGDSGGSQAQQDQFALDAALDTFKTAKLTDAKANAFTTAEAAGNNEADALAIAEAAGTNAGTALAAAKAAGSNAANALAAAAAVSANEAAALEAADEVAGNASAALTAAGTTQNKDDALVAAAAVSANEAAALEAADAVPANASAALTAAEADSTSVADAIAAAVKDPDNGAANKTAAVTAGYAAATAAMTADEITELDTAAQAVYDQALSGGKDPVTSPAVRASMTLTINGESVTLYKGDTYANFFNQGISFSFDALSDADIASGAERFGGLTATDSVMIGVNENQGKTLVIQTGANEGDNLGINLNKINSDSLGLTHANISTQASAEKAITEVNRALNEVSTQRAALGALQNRLEFKIANLDTSAENLQAAESRIRDVDMAKEMTAFTKNNILAQASTAMLAQANALPQGVLQLLG